MSPTNSEDPVRDFAYDPIEESPSRDSSGHATVYKTVISKERCLDRFESPPQRKQCCLAKQDVALLLTELEMKVVSPLEAEELLKTEVVQTLNISPQNKDVSEVQLNKRPLLLLFREDKTVREAYRRLYSLLKMSKPVAKPRLKSSYLNPGQLSSLIEALRTGIETGDSMLTLQHTTEIQQSSVSSTLESSGSAASVDSLSSHGMRDDIRHSTYRRLDSLEETIRELENTLIEISGYPTAEQLYTDTSTRTLPVQRTDSLTSETKKPPVPPKPSSLSPASIQVHCSHTCRVNFLLLKWPALFSLLLLGG